MKLRVAADLICDADALVGGGREKRYQKARFLVRQGVIPPDKPVSQGQTGEFGLAAVSALRLCLVLQDFGLPAAVTAKIAESFIRPIGPAENPEPRETFLEAISAVRSGREFYLKVEIGCSGAAVLTLAMSELLGPIVRKFEDEL